MVSDLDEGLRLCFEAVLHVSEMDCGRVYLVHEPSGALDLIFHQGLSPDFVRHTAHYDADSEKARLVMAGQPVYSEHQALEMSLDEAENGEGLRAFAVIPMKYHERVIGCLDVASHTLAEVPALAREALETIATQMCNLIVRLRTEEELRTRCHRLEKLLEERTVQLRRAQEQLQAETIKRRRALLASEFPHERALVI
jgi:transcriptional regulator with GAF, ATPase, and Fis domain